MDKPTIADIWAYIDEKDYKVDAESFHCFYEQKADGKGRWLVGKHLMSRWKSAVSLWNNQGWGITARSMARKRRRNNGKIEISRARQRDLYGAWLEGKTIAALKDLNKDPGHCPKWLIEEVLEKKKTEIVLDKSKRIG